MVQLNGRKLLTFYPTSPVLMPPDPEWGDHIHVTGYWYHPEKAGKEYQEPEDLEEFLKAEETQIFVAFGMAATSPLHMCNS